MELFLDFLLYAPYVTAVLLSFLTYCFYIESKYVVVEANTCAASIQIDNVHVRHADSKRRKWFTFVYRKKPAKELNEDDEDSFPA